MEDYEEWLAELTTDDVHPSVKPTPVVEESTKILPEVKAENVAERHN